MIRKGRPLSHSGRYPDGPRDAADGSGDPFDPFESFDAHDRAASHGPQRTQPQSHPSSSGPDFSGNASGPASEAIPEVTSEVTYTRSRRQPGEARPGQQDPLDRDETRKSQRPARSLKARALGYLSRREYSRAELARKLKPYVEETDSLDTVLDSLEAENWLSDSRFAESLMHRRSSRLGSTRILGELKQHALNPELVEEVGAQLRETELARAQAVWRKKFGQLPSTPAERAKQARFLASRGFSGTTIGKILKGIDETWDGG
ncbi:recombination regulator RecX [Paraburkholderia susongensis]|uniref:recombination regulator RecX n=1 Tax=Paraburkholderia susongensis TaxID=1515439 RepID=UPI00142D91CA|nr:recombination regulator RecX [Paraburkholderia susongensis]